MSLLFPIYDVCRIICGMVNQFELFILSMTSREMLKLCSDIATETPININMMTSNSQLAEVRNKYGNGMKNRFTSLEFLANYHYLHVIAYICRDSIANMRRFVRASFIYGDVAIYAAALSSFECARCDRYGARKTNSCRNGGHMVARQILPELFVDYYRGQLDKEPIIRRIIDFKLFGWHILKSAMPNYCEEMKL